VRTATLRHSLFLYKNLLRLGGITSESFKFLHLLCLLRIIFIFGFLQFFSIFMMYCFNSFKPRTLKIIDHYLIDQIIFSFRSIIQSIFLTSIWTGCPQRKFTCIERVPHLKFTEESQPLLGLRNPWVKDFLEATEKFANMLIDCQILHIL